MKFQNNCRFLLVPDSYKGTLTSLEVAQAISDGLKVYFPEASFDLCPLADGGEGSSSILGELLGASRYELDVISADHKSLRGFYYLTKDQDAFIEIAAASGLPSVKEPSRYAVRATSYGTGQLIRNALERGAKRVFLFLGGSATSDAGVGIAKALGYRFLLDDGTVSEIPVAGKDYPGEQLGRIVRILPPAAEELLSGVEFVAVCDVENPLYGPRGAAHVYSPQKGASPDDVRLINASMEHLSQVVFDCLGIDCADAPGAGAAGGAGYATLCFLNGVLQKGADFLLEAVRFEERLAEADCVISGEGQIDDQSVHGKLFLELLQRTSRQNKPLLVISGVNAVSEEIFEKYDNLSVFGLGRSDCFSEPKTAVKIVARNIGRLLAS